MISHIFYKNVYSASITDAAIFWIYCIKSDIRQLKINSPLVPQDYEVIYHQIDKVDLTG